MGRRKRLAQTMMDPIQRKQRAEQLLADDMFQEAFNAVEKSIVDKLKAGTTPLDNEWLLSLRLMAKIKGWFVQQINTGKIELHEANEKEARKS